MRDVFDALAEPTRRAILDELRVHDGRVVGELVERLGLSQTSVSKHLKVLRNAGLVTTLVEGQQRRYLLRPGGMREVEDWLAPHRAFWERRFDDLADHLDRTYPEEGP
ncbi:ArsR/SmtB family transcription factor [Saccharopolyspora sp. CA-218241]|uniref:ArsR/SmtB family transcription factor n=1 Tax=Saccharopolyspora sp. CA-218241 TaxID=3240027 RepID=UPI003D968F8B